MKGIVLAGGLGSRLYPITMGTCKQLVPIYDKPMIYYPLATLMLAGIREILLIATPEDIPKFYNLLRDGSHLGLSLTYKEQSSPKGIAEAFIIGKAFIANQPVALILGDNFFYGHKLQDILQKSTKLSSGAQIFGYIVKDPSQYGVLAFDQDNSLIDIIEKPLSPPSPYAVPGLYFYDGSVVDIAKSLRPSLRGELEITDINKVYLKKEALSAHLFDRGLTWLDTGTPKALQQAASYVEAIQERQGTYIACIEEIAYAQGFINHTQFQTLAHSLPNSPYGHYVKSIAQKP